MASSKRNCPPTRERSALRSRTPVEGGVIFRPFHARAGLDVLLHPFRSELCACRMVEEVVCDLLIDSSRIKVGSLAYGRALRPSSRRRSRSIWRNASRRSMCSFGIGSLATAS